jgi:CRISPR-associated protein Cas2
MIVLVLEKVPPRLRGELSRWCIEVATGVFVGTMSAVVRDLLWEKCCHQRAAGRCVLVHPARNEQGFLIRMDGDNDRRVVDLDGLALVAVRTARAAQHQRRRSRRLPAPEQG